MNRDSALGSVHDIDESLDDVVGRHRAIDEEEIDVIETGVCESGVFILIKQFLKMI